MPENVSAAGVANAFLDIQAGDASVFPRIDPMKMQKLLFYSAAWWLARRGTPLFPEEIYAWPWGPVVPNIYGAFAGCGRGPIVGRRATELTRTGPGPLNFHVSEPRACVDGEVGEFLRGLWASHKGYTGIQLSNATHAPGEPWTIVKERFGSLESKPLIPNSLIEEVFKAKLAR